MVQYNRTISNISPYPPNKSWTKNSQLEDMSTIYNMGNNVPPPFRGGCIKIVEKDLLVYILFTFFFIARLFSLYKFQNYQQCSFPQFTWLINHS